MENYTTFQILLFFTGLLIYAGAGLITLYRLWQKRLERDGDLITLLIAGLFLNVSFLSWGYFAGGSAQVPSKPETLVALSAGIVLMSLLLRAYVKSPMIIGAGTGIAVILMIFSSVFLFTYEQTGQELTLQTWLVTHVGMIIISYILFTMAFISGLMFLIQDRMIRKKQTGSLMAVLPSLEMSETVSITALYIGFPLLTLGLLIGILGGEYIASELSQNWYRDPKVILSLITWGVYAVVIWLHKVLFVKGRKFAYMSVIGFILVLFTTFVSEFLWRGFHQFQ